MKQIMKWVILSKSEYNSIKHEDDKIRELRKMIEDNDIEKERKLLEQKYKKYFDKWYLMDEGYVIQIKGVRYKYSGYSWEKFCFEAFVPNNEDYVDIDFDSITEKKMEELTEVQVKEQLGL
jgi:hypothetical protein